MLPPSKCFSGFVSLLCGIWKCHWNYQQRCTWMLWPPFTFCITRITVFNISIGWGLGNWDWNFSWSYFWNHLCLRLEGPDPGLSGPWPVGSLGTSAAVLSLKTSFLTFTFAQTSPEWKRTAWFYRNAQRKGLRCKSAQGPFPIAVRTGVRRAWGNEKRLENKCKILLAHCVQ